MNFPINESDTIVRPPYFYISGFSGIPHMKYYYIFIFFVFIISVLGNSFLMIVIYTDRSLHTPKYIAVFNLSITDLFESTSLIPQLLDTFLFGNQFISYAACLSNMFFVLLFGTMQSLTLTILSFDRLAAICFPLKYHMIVTHRSMFIIVGIAWTYCLVSLFVAAGFISKLSFCRSIVIESFYCDHGPMFRLACNNNFPSAVTGFSFPFMFLWFPMLFILISYTCIFVTVLKIATSQDRVKALRTCTSHLMLVAIFYLPVSITFGVGSKIHQNARIICLSMTSTIPPMLNPIIYTLKTEEFRVSVKKILKRKPIFPSRK
ncbi:olfactory receptor 10H2-like [Chanos chanos]|uniref:Olfactory receptor 10H2-like n=1 Tax=Chanos chanos TaxID=29144 RepID=A0A6J2WWD9_CHACN|nr:olfactory receptor 10H2-like [Chanos chanos]